jgi:hypothetical protein
MATRASLGKGGSANRRKSPTGRSEARGPAVLVLTALLLGAWLPAVSANPGLGGAAVLTAAWVEEGAGSHLYMLASAGPTMVPLWDLTVATPIDDVNVLSVGGAALLVLARHLDDGHAMVELREPATGVLLCSLVVDRPHVGHYSSQRNRLAAADVLANAPGQELVFMAAQHYASPRDVAKYLAVDAQCRVLRTLTSSVTTSHSSQVDDTQWVDVTGDGIADGVSLYGSVLYSGPQPRIEVADLARGEIGLRVDSNRFHGSGMTSFQVGDFAGGDGPDFLTGGWWGPNVAAYDETGALLWSGLPTGACGNADSSTIIDGERPNAAIYAGTGSYGRCSPVYISRLDPATGAVLWKAAAPEPGRNYIPVGVGEFDGDPETREVVAMESDPSSCPRGRALNLLRGADGGLLVRHCDPGLDLRSEAMAFLPDGLPGEDAVYAAAHGPFAECPAGAVCLFRFGSGLALRSTTVVATTSAPVQMRAIPLTQDGPGHAELAALLEQVLAAVERLGSIVRTEGHATRQAVDARADDLRGALGAVREDLLGDGLATRSAVEAHADRVLEAVGDDVATARRDLLADGADTRSVVESQADRVIAQVGADIASLAASVAAGFSRVTAALDGLAASVGQGFTDVLVAVGAVEAEVEEVQSTLEQLDLTDPLEVHLAAPPGPAGWDGPFFATVLQRGQLVDATLTLLLDGVEEPRAKVTSTVRPGLYIIEVPTGREATGSHALTVLARLGDHHGAATAWYGLGLTKPGADPEGDAAGAVAKADAVVQEAAYPVRAGLSNATLPPERREVVEVVLLDVSHALPPHAASVPGAEAAVASIKGGPDANGDYSVTWKVADRTSGSVALPGLGLLPPAQVALLSVPETSVEIPAYRVELQASYRFDRAAPPCIVQAPSGCLRAPAPASPDWALEAGTSLRLVIRLVDGKGSTVVERSVEVPLAGQVLGWATASAPQPT